jgi:6-pyruvoyl-tetrahydropterin synthase
MNPVKECDNREEKSAAKNYKISIKLKPAREHDMVAINSDEVKSVLKEAFDYILIKKDKVELKQYMIKVLLESELDDGKINNMDPKEVDKFVNRVCTLLEAKSKKLSGDDK